MSSSPRPRRSRSGRRRSRCTHSAEWPSPPEQSDRAGRVFDALADPTRRTVVEALAARETATATQLAAELPVTRQAVSKHLNALDAAGLVEHERRGRETHYRLTPQALSSALDWMERVGAQWEQRLAALRRRFPA